MSLPYCAEPELQGAPHVPGATLGCEAVVFLPRMGPLTFVQMVPLGHRVESLLIFLHKGFKTYKLQLPFFNTRH